MPAAPVGWALWILSFVEPFAPWILFAQLSIVTFGSVLCVAACFWSLWDYFFPDPDEPEGVPEPAAEPAPDGRGKRVGKAYVLWLCGGAVGAHLFYLDRVVHGVAAAWSANFLGFGLLVDLAIMPHYVEQFNDDMGVVHPQRPCNIFHLIARFILAVGLYFYLATLFLTRAPRALHNAGLVDLDARMAQTLTNPYELLGATRQSTARELGMAYARNIQGLGKCNGNATCESAKDQINRAAKYCTTSVAPRGRNNGGPAILEEWATLRAILRDGLRPRLPPSAGTRLEDESPPIWSSRHRRPPGGWGRRRATQDGAPAPAPGQDAKGKGQDAQEGGGATAQDGKGEGLDAQEGGGASAQDGKGKDEL